MPAGASRPQSRAGRAAVRAAAPFAALALVAACGSASGGTTHAANSSVADPVGVTIFPAGSRQPAPTLSGTTLDGRSLSLATFAAGRIVVVNAWASWCSPCREESPMLATAARTLRGQGVRFLGLDEQDDLTKARAFVRSVGSTYPHLVDRDGSLLHRLRLLPQLGIPSSLVIDRHGRMAARVIGAMSSAQLRQIVARLHGEA